MPISTLAAHYIKTTTRLSNATPTDGEMYKISVKSANAVFTSWPNPTAEQWGKYCNQPFILKAVMTYLFNSITQTTDFWMILNSYHAHNLPTEREKKLQLQSSNHVLFHHKNYRLFYHSLLKISFLYYICQASLWSSANKICYETSSLPEA